MRKQTLSPAPQGAQSEKETLVLKSSVDSSCARAAAAIPTLQHKSSDMEITHRHNHHHHHQESNNNNSNLNGRSIIAPTRSPKLQFKRPEKILLPSTSYRPNVYEFDNDEDDDDLFQDQWAYTSHPYCGPQEKDDDDEARQGSGGKTHHHHVTSPALAQDKIPHKKDLSHELTMAYLALIAVQVSFAVNVVLIRYATHYVENIVIITMREVICTTLLGVIAHCIHRPSQRHASGATTPSPWEEHLTILCGVLGICAHLYFVSRGIQLTSAVTATIFATSRPVFAALIAFFFTMEAPQLRHRAIGILLGIVGECVALSVWDLDSKKTSFLMGCLYLLASNMCYGAYLVMLKVVLRTCPLPLFLSRAFFVGLLGILIIAVANYSAFGKLADAPAAVWLVGVFGGLIVSPIPYALNGFAVQRVSPVIAALFSNLEAPMCAVLAVTFLGETATWSQVAGFSIVAVGVTSSAFGEMRRLSALDEETLDGANRQCEVVDTPEGAWHDAETEMKTQVSF